MKQEKANPEIQTILKEYNADVKRHMSVLSEDFKGQVKLIAEQYGDIKKTLDSHTETLASHTEMIGSLKEDVEIIKVDLAETKKDVEVIKVDLAETKKDVEVIKVDLADTKKDVEVIKVDLAETKKDVEVIKSDIEFIKGGLKKKVDYDEFAALERRMTLLESKVRR